MTAEDTKVEGEAVLRWLIAMPGALLRCPGHGTVIVRPRRRFMARARLRKELSAALVGPPEIVGADASTGKVAAPKADPPVTLLAATPSVAAALLVPKVRRNRVALRDTDAVTALVTAQLLKIGLALVVGQEIGPLRAAFTQRPGPVITAVLASPADAAIGAYGVLVVVVVEVIVP